MVAYSKLIIKICGRNSDKADDTFTAEFNCNGHLYGAIMMLVYPSLQSVATDECMHH